MPTVLSPSTGSTLDDYRALTAQVRRAGLLRRRPWYYAMKIALTIAGFAAGWVAFFVVGNSWATLGVAVYLAVLSTQVVFIGHDAGHQQIAGSRRANRCIGLIVGDALTGLSFGWWVPKHNAHHAHPNQVGRDPDIGAGLVGFAITASAAPDQSLAIRLRTRFQAWLFLLVLLLQGLGLHVTSVQSVLRRRDRTAAVERVLLAANAAAYLTMVFWVLAPVKALVFIAVQQGLFGLYLGCTFAPNHKGMPIIDRDADVPFVRRQVLTARNVVGGRLTTFLLGGLDYQIEHHLFPTMPRPNLARAQRFVQAHCVEHGLPYRQERPAASYRQALHNLQTSCGDHDQVLSTATGAPHG